MSYKTNPILNRIKINKGWKSPYLPTKTLNYTRDFALWFKVYLLLKTFLNLKGIQLLSCEIRFEQQNKKILYILINKKWTKKKEKRKRTKILKRIQTPIWKNTNRNAIFFLYKNYISIKNTSFWKQNFVQKKVLSKFWLAKPKNSTWLNTLKKIQSVRQDPRSMAKRFKAKQKFHSLKHAEIQFYTSKQKQVLASLGRAKKINSFLYIKLFQLTQQKKSQVLRKLIENLQKKIKTNKIYTQKINKIYNFLLLANQNFDRKKTQKNTYTIAVEKIQQYKLKFVLKKLKNKTNSFQRTRILKNKLPTLLLKINENVFKKIHNYRWSFLKNEILFKKFLNLNLFFGQVGNKNWFLDNYFLMLNWNSKFCIKTQNKNLMKNNFLLKELFLKSLFKFKFVQSTKKNITKKVLLKNNFYKLFLWRELRLEKKRKKKTLGFNKNMQAKKINFFNYNIFLTNKKFVKKKNQIAIAKGVKKINKLLKKNKIAKYYQYRIPYRKIYFNFLRLTTNLNLKYLIQDWVKKYFFIQVEAKILHAFNDYKNQKYFRLIFPVYKKKKNHLIKKYRQKSWKQKQIFLATQLQFITSIKKQIKQHLIGQKRLTEMQTRDLTKKKFNLLTQKKKKQRRIKNKFARIKRSKDFRQSFKYFIPTFMQFSRTLDPQLLISVLTKVIKMAKNQTWVLNNLKYILRSLNLPKNIGYRIALAGRIDSKKKSRLIYFTRKNNPLQVFKKNMNFAYAQSNARIGTFGIKIWIYF